MKLVMNTNYNFHDILVSHMNRSQQISIHSSNAIISLVIPCSFTSFAGVVNGGWSSWSGWSQCTEKKICYHGQRSRSRDCNNPAPSMEGDDCAGAEEEQEACPTKACAGVLLIKVK